MTASPLVFEGVSAPAYELRVRHFGLADDSFEVWQIPNASTPNLTGPRRIGGLRGRNLGLVEHRVRRRLAEVGVRPVSVEGEFGPIPLTEDIALTLGLLFRVLAPMRSRERMRAVAEGIEAMGREEAAYWLGMAMHRSNPRRVLNALRVLLTSPDHKSA